RHRDETLVSSSPAPDQRPHLQTERDRRGRRTGSRREARSGPDARILPHHQLAVRYRLRLLADRLPDRSRRNSLRIRRPAAFGRISAPFLAGASSLQLRLDRISLRCALPQPRATARRAVDDHDAEARAAADCIEISPRPAPGPAGARTLETRFPFGSFAGGRTQSFSAHSLPTAPRGRHVAPGPER